jgi:hypothetical protein
MTAQVIPHPALHLAERIEDARNEVAFCAMNVRTAQAVLDQRAGELELAREELAALEAQRLGWCAPCGTHHIPLSEPCEPASPCPDCQQVRCAVNCPNRYEDPGD